MNNFSVISKVSTKESDDNFVEEQFHEQFAENYNSISSYIIAFILGLIAGLTPFCIIGKRLIQNYFDFVSPTNECVKTFYSNICLFTVATLLSFGLFIIIEYLIIKQGWAIRRDQFIVYAIRIKNYKKMNAKPEIDSGGVFPHGYSPFNKEGADILVGTFCYLYNIMHVCMYVIFSVSLLILIVGLVFNLGSLLDRCILFLCIVIVFLSFFLCIRMMYNWLKRVESKYKTLNDTYTRIIIKM